MYWLHNGSSKHVTDDQIVFNVNGHSYLLADCVFGRVERKLCRNDRIILPSHYINICRQFGKVYRLGTDWRVCDLKVLLAAFQKYQGIKTTFFKKHTKY